MHQDAWHRHTRFAAQLQLLDLHVCKACLPAQMHHMAALVGITAVGLQYEVGAVFRRKFAGEPEIAHWLQDAVRIGHGTRQVAWYR